MEAEIRIERLAAGGDGVGRLPDGRVVFVPFTAPGDLVRARVDEQRKRFARASLVEVLEPGPGHTRPECPAFGECGGCTWQHLDPETQLAAKRALVEDALHRIGGLDPPGPVRVTPSPRAYGYRARARLRVERGRIGYRRRRSHALRAVSRCPVLTPALEQRLARLAGRRRLRDGDLELHEDRMRVGADEVRVSRGVFAQANPLLAGALAAAVARAAGEGERAVELFAGAGTLTLALARRFRRLVAVEGSPRAAADLRANLAAAGIDWVEIRETSVEAALAELARASEVADCVVLDPPRAGLSAAALAALRQWASARVVYVSCDPATLARDLAALCEGGGYRLLQVEAFDLFPQTPHVEVLAALARAEG